MTTDHRVSLENDPRPSDIQAIMQGLVDFNTEHVGGERQQYLVATVRDAAGGVW
jgi:hypothetical protein